MLPNNAGKNAHWRDLVVCRQDKPTTNPLETVLRLFCSPHQNLRTSLLIPPPEITGKKDCISDVVTKPVEKECILSFGNFVIMSKDNELASLRVFDTDYTIKQKI
jgi:hypothetical protein